MDVDSTTGDRGAGRGDVMAAVDDDRFLVADVTRDDAWLSIRSADAPELAAYR